MKFKNYVSGSQTRTALYTNISLFGFFFYIYNQDTIKHIS